MTTLTIQIPDKDKDLFLQVLKKFNAKVVVNSKKEKLIAGISQGLQEVKEIQEGKRKPLTLKDI